MTKRTIFALVMLAASAQFFAASASAAATETDQWCVPAAAITDDGEISRTVAVPPTTDVRTIVGVRVRVAATHPWVGDLSFRVRHPSGIEVVLVDRPGIPSVGFPGPWGCGGDNIDCWFDDAAVAAAETTCSVTAVPVLAGSLRPTGSLASLKGLAPQGVWTLTVSDSVAGDAGQLTAACIEITTAPDCNVNGVDDAVDIAAGTSADVDEDGVPDECGCIADLDGDGAVTGADLAVLLGAWGSCAACGADLTGDGQVLGDDLAVLLSSWGACGAS
jgi:subtilisin-like proprotein convertase family protein